MNLIKIYIGLTIFCFLNGHLIFALDAHQEKERILALRKIGHEVLLQFGDSSSRVLPIIKNEKAYRIEFETAFAINPRQLVETINQAVLESGLAESYFVEVEECLSKEIAYLYKMEAPQEDFSKIQCGERDLPKACYSIILFLIEEKDNTLPRELEAVEAKENSGHIIYFISTLLTIILGSLVGLFIYKKKNKEKSTTTTELLDLGNYQIDKINSQLIFEETRIELSGKEYGLLLTLYQSLNHTIEKEQILSAVWGDQGDYVGRTLDVYISKLRKKLQADPNLKIVNIRGVGYKLVWNKA